MDFCVWISTLLFQIFRFTDWSDFDELWSMDTSIHSLFLWYHKLSEMASENLYMGKLCYKHWTNIHAYFAAVSITLITKK